MNTNGYTIYHKDFVPKLLAGRWSVAARYGDLYLFASTLAQLDNSSNTTFINVTTELDLLGEYDGDYVEREIIKEVLDIGALGFNHPYAEFDEEGIATAGLTAVQLDAMVDSLITDVPVGKEIRLSKPQGAYLYYSRFRALQEEGA